MGSRVFTTLRAKAEGLGLPPLSFERREKWNDRFKPDDYPASTTLSGRRQLKWPVGELVFG